MRRVGVGSTGLTLLLSLTSALSTGGSAQATTDVTPPAIGSCFDMTAAEVRAASNDNPPVPCTSTHTTSTFDIVEFAEPPDWNDEDSFSGDVYDQCNLSWMDLLGGDPLMIGRSSYTYYWLMPTPDQRAAGAAWVRCELALTGGDDLAPLPANVILRGLPLPDRVARCREGEPKHFQVTVCSRPHQYRAKYSFELPWTRWRGEDAAQDFAYRKCDQRISGHFYYQWPNSRYWWRLGWRYATCFTKTRN